MNNDKKQLYYQRLIVFEDDSFIELQENEYQTLLKELERYKLFQYNKVTNENNSGIFRSNIIIYDSYGYAFTKEFQSDYLKISNGKLYFNYSKKAFKNFTTKLTEDTSKKWAIKL